MGHDVTCPNCGETYYSVGDHQCPGTDRDRIETLEAQVFDLQDQIREIQRKLGLEVAD